PGDALPTEALLSQQFGVSRTVIRESVKRVEEKGLVTVVQGRGTTVNPPSTWNVIDPVVLSALVDHDDDLGVLDDLTVVRASLEASMARAAAERRTEQRQQELRDAYDRMIATIDDVDAYNEARSEEHTSELQSRENLVCRLLLEKKKKEKRINC